MSLIYAVDLEGLRYPNIISKKTRTRGCKSRKKRYFLEYTCVPTPPQVSLPLFSLLCGEVVFAGTGQGVRTGRVVLRTHVPLRPEQAGGTSAQADGHRTGSPSFGDSDRHNRAKPCCSDVGSRWYPFFHAARKRNRPLGCATILLSRLT